MIPAHWFNPDLNYETYMAPGILVLLVTMIGTFLSAMNVVREKEIGTIESMPVDFFLLRLCQRRSTYTLPGQRPLPSIEMCTPRDQHERRATLAATTRQLYCSMAGIRAIVCRSFNLGDEPGSQR